jgi:hypothetical protein
MLPLGPGTSGWANVRVCVPPVGDGVAVPATIAIEIDFAE